MSSSAPKVTDLPTSAEVLPQARNENFTVASFVLGRRQVKHLTAIYGFARLVDDVGDESAGDRGALLDLVESELRRAFGQADGVPPSHPVFRTLSVTVRECALPIEPFERLIEANRMDQLTVRYESFDQLLAYCQLSAAPVGELVLGVFGAATAERIALSDSICAALQIVEHLQDIGEDRRNGRVYLPREDMVRFGCEDEDLTADSSKALTALVEFESARARALFRAGAPLARTLPLGPRVAVAGFIAGGRRALAGLQDPGRRLPLLRELPRAMAGR